jgi:hypothetical protein
MKNANKHDKTQPKAQTDTEPKIYTGKEANKMFVEKMIKPNYRATIPDNPLSDNKRIKFTAKDEPLPQGYRELLTKDEIDLLKKALPELTDTALEAILRRVYIMNTEDLKKVTYEKVLGFVKDYLQTKPKEEQSKALSMKQWGKILELSTNELRKIRKSENPIYHFQQATPRRWTLPMSELPVEYLEMYRYTVANRENRLKQAGAQ